ncbi:MAG: hypothetical protein M3Z75_13380 [Actinomycetota bacterium]|nr:hypothetical protein [Actinomycetota bacterium]
MPADYEKIREENIARYGWDTAVLDLLGQLYSERTHFIFELIQNAEDAGATELAFELFEDRLELRHDGRPFTQADVRGVCGVGHSGKSADLTKIGKFGIGFKSVYAYTRTPHIYSAAEQFRIESFVRPFAVAPRASSGTLFAFPFDHDTVPAATAVREISAALTAIKPRILLFLTHIGRLRVAGPGMPSTGMHGTVIDRQAENRPGGSRRVMLSKGRGYREEWLLWHRPVEGHPAQRIEIAFRAEAGQLARCEDSPLTVFFPTEKQTFLGCLIQGPYRTTPARDNIPEQDPANQALVRQTAGLLADVLRELRDDGLLTVEVLQALPLDTARFAPGSMFRPLFEAVREALATEPLIPVAGGGYGGGGHGGGGDLVLAQGAELLELLDPGQLGVLYGTGRPARFAAATISEHLTPVLWRYLRDEIGLAEVTPEDMVSRLTREFLQAQSDDWIARLYAFLFRHSRLWREEGLAGEPAGPARAKPVIRLEDGRHVAPFDAQDRPAVYLPSPVASSLPTVRRAVAESRAAGPFLAALNLAEPDVTAEVLQIILPRYHGLDLAGLDPVQHDADLECVVRALDEAAADQRSELLAQLRETPFLIGENAATGEQRLMPPPRLYQRAKDLETYFDGNPDAWFAADGYGPWRLQLRGMGVRPDVEVRARTTDQLGYVIITVDFGRNERGLDGFDPDARIDGLDFALRHPSHGRSEFLWNVLLAPNRRLVAGVVERSVLQSYADSSRDHVESAIAVAAKREAWLPGRDGTFRRPAELSLDDLPPAYTRDEGLAQALHMLQPVVAQAARQLGLTPDVLWGLSAHPDLVALIKRELALRRAGPDEPGLSAEGAG